MACDRLTVEGSNFRDESGRSIILRGVNLGGDCKVPYPYGGTNYPSDFSDHRSVSFVGRPFPLEEADEHLGRLRHWGFNVLRLLTCWEAVEHAGPGLYDSEYIDYFAELCRRANEHGLYVVVDFHQDVWSRMTGGSGAPGWTFEAVGLDFTRFGAAGAAHVMQYAYNYARGGWQDAYPQMSWGANHRLPPASIMWTLFWTGRLFTPQLQVDGCNIQDFLQNRYLGAMDALARGIAHLPNVVGFDTLNEPVTGWIGHHMRYRHVAPTPQNPLRPRIGMALSPLDCLLAARGIPVTAPFIERDPQTGALSAGKARTINAARLSIWKNGVSCPFEEAGAYRLDGDRLADVHDDFFQFRDGERLSSRDHAYAPFFHRVADTIRAHNPDWALFAEIEPYAGLGGEGFPLDMPERSVNGSHWYDYSTLYTKRFNPDAAFDFNVGKAVYGREALKTSYIDQLKKIMHHAEGFSEGGAPTLIGEFGIPYDLDHGAAFAAWQQGDRSETPWVPHVEALTLTYEAFDELQLHSTQWNYTASNRNDLMIGDGWNQEDLSIFSRDQQVDPGDPDSGGRAIAGFCRPYVRRVAGQLVTFKFNHRNGTADIILDADGSSTPTEIYVPRIHFGPTPSFIMQSGSAEVEYDPSSQLAFLSSTKEARLHMRIVPRRH